ncbi:MAG: hypothetical protein ABL900_05835 [Burkholderiaceae bacterium]
MNGVIAPGQDAVAPWADLNDPPDSEHLRGALQRGLEGFQTGAFTIDEVRTSKVRRSSSLRRNPHPITMCLDLQVRDCASGGLRVQRFYAKAFRGGASAAAFAATDRSALVAPAIGVALAHVEELDMLLWAWPNDPSLPQLAVLVDPLRLPGHLPEAVRALGTPVGSADVLRCEPEQRATLACTLVGADAAQAHHVVFGKTFLEAHMAQTLHERFDHFWQLAQTDRAAPWVAQSLGWDRATRTLWQAAAPGQPLMAVAQSEDAGADFARIGGALARLHLAALPVSKSRSTEHWLAELRRLVQKIGRIAPHLAARALALGETMQAATLRLPPVRQAMIHGDFHPEQVWLHGERVVFFDFDEFSLGNPMEDLAEFSVKLAQSGVAPQRCERHVASLIAAYRDAAPHLFSAPWLQWHRALQTLLQASRAFIYQEPGWPGLVDVRLAASQHLAASLLLEEAA